MKKIIFMLSASLLLLVACSKDDEALVRQNGDVTFVNKTFSASCKAQKAAFVPNTVLEQGFQSGDQVFIYGANYGNAIGQPGYISSSDVREDNDDFYKWVNFDVQVPANETSFHALMPYQDIMKNGEVALPIHQVAPQGSNDRNANILYASTSTNSEHVEKFNFQLACAYIRLRVKNNQKGVRFVIHSTVPLSGMCSYEFGDVFRLTGTTLNGGDSVSLTTVSSSAFANDTAYIATVLPTSENSTVIYEVKDNTGKVVASCAVINRKFVAGSVYTVTLDGDKLTATGEMAGMGKFSVSDDTKVIFSKGNLQYNAYFDTWRFAEHQWDYVGSPSQNGEFNNVAPGNVENGDNANISGSYDGWIDLFGYGTSKTPTKYTTVNTDYSEYIDWGTNSKLITDIGVGWRTLSYAEWAYLIDNDKYSRNGKCGHATVNGVVGIVLLPDEWLLPDGCEFTAGLDNGWTTNEYEGDAWMKMETAGAVFLPTAGERNGQYAHYVGKYGNYWSATPNGNSYAYGISFYSSCVDVYDDYYRFLGQSVRLVR